MNVCVSLVRTSAAIIKLATSDYQTEKNISNVEPQH